MSLAGAWGQSTSVPLNEVLSRMQATHMASRDSQGAYIVTRQYVLSDSDPGTPDGKVTAQISFLPPAEKAYTLGRVQGGDRVEKVVRKVLDHENEMTTHAERAEVSPRNYEFSYIRQDLLQGHRCYVLQLKPRRQASELLNGLAWVDAENFRIRQIEGELAKSPSWWVKNVNVTIAYGEVLGTWVQLDSRAVADVRLMGKYTLTSQALDLRTETVTAKNLSTGHPSRARRSVANTAVWILR